MSDPAAVRALLTGVGDPAAVRAVLTGVGDPADVRAVLAAVGDGIGCEHWTLPEHGLPVVLLADLGFAKPITTRIPRCADHGCHLVGACAQEIVFAEGRDGRSGRKFRLTPGGQAAASEPAHLAAALADLPLAVAVLAALADGPRTLFELNWALVEPRRAALASGDEPPPMPSRAYLRAALALLAAHGAVDWDEATGVVALSGERTAHGSAAPPDQPAPT